MRSSARPLAWLALAAAFAFGLWVHFAGLGEGAPSWDKDLQVFGSREELERWAQPMLEMRRKYYAGVQEMLDPGRPFQATYDALYHANRATPLFQPLPRDFLLDRMRGYAVGTFISDEQNTMQALSRLNPRKLEFNPGVNSFYGGFYYAACGAALLCGKLAGRISLTPDALHYFTHPEETRRMYALIRALGGISVLLTAALLFLWVRRAFDHGTAALTVLFFITLPALVPYSHLAKAHLFGTFLFLLGSFFMWKTLETPALRNYLWAGLLLGCSAGSIITNLPVGIVILLVELERARWNPVKALARPYFWIACAVFFLAYLATNFYIFAHFASFRRSLLALKEYMSGYHETYGEMRMANWLPFFKALFKTEMRGMVLLPALWGALAGLRRRQPLLVFFTVTCVFLTAMNLALTRHPGVSLRVFPMAAVLAAAGCRFLMETRGRAVKLLVGVYAAAAILISGLQSAFYLSLMREPSFMDRAGAWINANVPAGASIGVVDGQISQASFPPIHFLNYRLVAFPVPGSEDTLDPRPLPEYLVTTLPADSEIARYYDPAAVWQRPKGILGLSFPTVQTSVWDADLSILKRRTGS